jgi:mevalonate kinase
MAWPWNNRRVGKRWVKGKTFRLADEVHYIQRRASRYDSRIVSIGQLLLFSSETGDAWLLDPVDHLAAPLAKDGEPISVEIEDSDTAFTVHWMGSFRVEGDAFIYRSNKSRNVRTILGYPTRLLKDQISNMFG